MFILAVIEGEASLAVVQLANGTPITGGPLNFEDCWPLWVEPEGCWAKVELSRHLTCLHLGAWS